MKNKQYVINGNYYKRLNQFCTTHKIDLIHLHASVWIYYKSIITRNSIETIGIINDKNLVITRSFTIDKDQLAMDFLNRVSDAFNNNINKVENDNDISSNLQDIVLYQNDGDKKVDFNLNKHELIIGISKNENKIFYNYISHKISDEMLFIIHNRIIRICEQIITNEQIRIEEIELLDEKELNKVLYEFNNTNIEYPKDETIIELFEKQVEKTPKNVAIEFEKQSLTYQELNGKINYIGELLRNQGIKPDDIVAIISDRSIELMVGIFGILKAGAAYLPIATDLPINRINYMIKDSGTKVVVAGPGSEHIIQELKDVIVVNLYENSKILTNNLQHLSKPNNLAYVIYTSGTTGNPKGVMVENRHLVNLISWMVKDNYTENEVILNKTTFTFDLSVWELFVWFLSGSKLVLLSQNDEKDPKRILEKIKEHKVTRISFVPSVLEEFLPYVEDDALRTLKKIQLSGEALPVELANNFNKLSNGKITLINSYGPTEATVFATSVEVANTTNLTMMHVGKPLANTQIYILNDNKLCGIGMVGELYIGGAGVSRGYLNRPELTDEKFINNPFKIGEKIYGTGDLARWLENGNIEYLGRMDDQVKIRGFRIELGEIRSRLREIEDIQNAIVIAREENKDKYLCAYVVSNKKIDVVFIKNQLIKSLPEYMIPTHIVQIDSMPVTKNGKLDKNALPKPEIVSNKKYIKPRNNIEKCIGQAFEQVLNLDKVGIDDNFFELGGHSLRATRLVNILEKTLGVQISLREILTEKSIRELAKSVEARINTYQYAPIEVQANQNSYEMSSVQKRLYVIEEMQESSTAYNIPIIMKMTGSLDFKRLYTAFNKLCERHELLRTHFYNFKGSFQQVIEETVDFSLEYEEVTEKDVDSILKNFIRPFNLRKAPLMRAKAIKTNTDETILIMDIHHIIYDEGSANVLFKDLTNLYEGISLPQIKVQYKDYSAWQNKRDLSKQESYWLEEFSNEILKLDLHADYPRPQQQSHKGNSITMLLNEELKQSVKDISIKTGATENIILLSTFMILLSRYSRQEEIIIGSPISGRTHPDTENMLGMFVNTLAIKGNLNSKQKYLDFIEHMKEKCFKAYENQEYPFEQLVENLKIDRDPSRNPLFDVMFVLQNNEESELVLEDKKLEPIKIQSTGSTFDITVSINDIDNGYEMTWEYCTDLFKQETIERMGKHFKELLKNLISNPYKELHKAKMLGDEEEERVLTKFNLTKMDCPNNKTIIELFEEQVKKTPDKIAIKFQEQTLTYKQLNARANYVGALLRGYGVKAESIVGIVTERSLEMIIGIYGILKAGGAYLPIAPDYPEDRINYLLSDSGVEIVLTGPGSNNVMNIMKNTKTLDLKNCTQEIEENLQHVSAPNNLAYIIYTSGTTGNPKGVMIENRNVVNLAYWQIINGEYDENTIIIQKTTYVFDGSVWEIFPITLAGCTLELISEAQNNDLEKLLELIPNKQIALIPSMFRLLLDYAKINNKVNQLNFDKLYLAAEPLTADLVEKYSMLVDGKLNKLNNLYGPTEATVTATSYQLSDNDKLDNIPIGKPIYNTQIYIINDSTLCGIGVPGELCIGGSGVSRGYLNRPELTAEKFVENPYRKSEKMYRTGDLARWLEDGNIEYLGRIDEQIKIRGFRIEMGEIENRLREIEGIQDATIIDKGKNGDKYLCAYIVGNETLNINYVKKQLSEKLPEYMIPTHMMQLKSLPITKNGKLDKKALPEPKIISTNEFIAPRNEIEYCVAMAFQEILGIDEVGIDDSFFELGGHSLRASRLVNTLEEKLGIRVSLRDVLAEKTVRKLAVKIKETTYRKEYSPIDKQPEKSSYDMSSAQKRLYIIDQLQGSNIIYNTPIQLKVDGKFNLVHLQESLNELCKRHELLRTHFVQDKDKFLQIIESNAKIELEFEEAKVTAIAKISEEFVRPFDLRKSPLMRAKVIQSSENEAILLIDVHHIICDGGATAVLLGDLSRLYNGETLGNIKVQYKDFSIWQNSNDTSEGEKYWLEEFSEKIPVLDLHTDYQRAQHKSYKGNTLITKLNDEQKNIIRAFSKETGATEYMILLSSFMLLMSKYSRQEEIVVGSPIAGRNHPDTENMLGMFVNTLAIKGHFNANKKFIDLIHEMKEKCFKAYTYQDYPFESLIEKIEIDRDPSRNPLFDVMFAVQNNEKVELTLGNSKLIPVNLEANVAKFDLTVSVEETLEGYELSWEYCTDLFKKDTIARMSEHFKELLSTALQNPQKKLCEIDLLSNFEKEKVLKEFNETHIMYPSHKSIIEIFEDQVAKNPKGVAVEFENETLTYEQLNERANYVGEHLRKMGVKPDNIVGLITKRSMEMIIGIYGILKSGGAYVPIDVNHPIDRVKYMLKDCETQVLLTGTGTDGIVSELQDYKIIDLKKCEGKTTNNLIHVTMPSNLAYIIFTSGTTGNPKGVMVENRNLLNLINSQILNGDINENSVVLQKSTYIFDASVWEIFLSGLSGSKLQLLSENNHNDPEELFQIFMEKQITHALIVPSMFRMLLEYAENHNKAEGFNTFRRIFLGAEELTADLVEKYIDLTGNKIDTLTNLYGPTEGTVCVTSYNFSSDTNLCTIPIGKPILNTQVYILNGNSLCGIGMPGELCISGASISRGYLNRIDLTSEKFVKNPYNEGEGIYRTGDLARWMEDGNIEYLGRLDEQVKIRGFRIELGEIENTLREIFSVQDAVVIAKGNNGNSYLCGYIASDKKIDINTIKKQLAESLPEYMIPTYIVQLEKFPVTRSGKIDKKSLPEPEIMSTKEYVAPRNEEERFILQAFQEILAIDKLSIDDSFFELGGNSLSATRLVNIIEQKTGIRISLRNVLTGKTIRKLAESVKEQKGASIYFQIAAAIEEEV